mgnify:CR=1 FL=1
MRANPRDTARLLIVCDCCGTEGLGTLLRSPQGDRVEIRARRHGVWHHLTLEMAVLAQLDLAPYYSLQHELRRP